MSKPLSILVDSLWSPYSEVRPVSLSLLALVVKQLEVPESMLSQTIRPAVLEVATSHRGSARQEDTHIAQLANRVIWHIDLLSMTHQPQRLEFLKGQLDNWDDGFYYPYEALDHITKTATSEARSVLEEKLAESKTRSMSAKLLERIEIGIEKIDLLIGAYEMEPAAQVQEFAQAFMTSLPNRRHARRDFRIWLIQHLAELNVPESKAFLMRVWQWPEDKTEEIVRYTAEQALIAFKLIPEDERTIILE